jgi:hypothetical protein
MSEREPEPFLQQFWAEVEQIRLLLARRGGVNPSEPSRPQLTLIRGGNDG